MDRHYAASKSRVEVSFPGFQRLRESNNRMSVFMAQIGRYLIERGADVS